MSDPRSPRRKPSPYLTAVPAVVLAGLLLVLAGCGGSSEKKEAGPTPAQVLAEAKKRFDDASSVRIDLATKSTPAQGNGVLGATGVLTRDPAFAGDVKVLLGGLTATVPVTSVGGKVYARLPLQTKYSVIDPTEYGAPDPAGFADPANGLSALLGQLDGLAKGKQTRDGDTIVTTYSGELPGQAVKKIIPSADASTAYTTTVGVDGKGYATSVKITGPFFADGKDVTYDVGFSDYGSGAKITAPTS